MMTIECAEAITIAKTISCWCKVEVA